MMQLSTGLKRYSANTGWLLFERILAAVILLFVSVYMARYLGPSKYGLLSYAISFVALFSALATLGLDSIVVRNLVQDSEKRDELLGTAFTLKCMGAFFLLGILAIAVRFTTNDSLTTLLIFIIAAASIFQSFNVIFFYFQSKVLSKYAVYARIASVLLSAGTKLLLIYLRAGLIYFAAVILIESIILAAGLVAVYTKRRLSIFNWKVRFKSVRALLGDSWPLILSGVAVSIHMRIDQVMIKGIIGSDAVGNYAVAVKLSEAWYFIPVAIATSLFPAIVNAKKIDNKLYFGRLQRLYCLMTWLAIGIALPITFLANDIIRLLFGVQYGAAAGVLRIYVWSGAFTFLGVANSKYLIAENYTRIAFLRSLIGVLVNVFLNIILIPRHGINGAAIATLISYSVSTFFIVFIPKTSKQAFMMLISLNPFKFIGKRIQK